MQDPPAQRDVDRRIGQREIGAGRAHELERIGTLAVLRKGIERLRQVDTDVGRAHGRDQTADAAVAAADVGDGLALEEVARKHEAAEDMPVRHDLLGDEAVDFLPLEAEGLDVGRIAERTVDENLGIPRAGCESPPKHA